MNHSFSVLISDWVLGWMRGVVGDEVWNRIRVPISQHLLILVAFLGLTTVLGLDKGWFLLVQWWVGLILGWVLFDVDHVMDVFWIHSEREVNKDALKMLTGREWSRLGVWLIDSASSRTSLLFHSIVFEVILFVLAIYVVTSGETFFAKAVVFGLLLRTLYDQARVFVKTGSLGYWLWQLRDEIPDSVQAMILSLGFIVGIWLTWYVV